MPVGGEGRQPFLPTSGSVLAAWRHSIMRATQSAPLKYDRRRKKKKTAAIRKKKKNNIIWDIIWQTSVPLDQASR